ncbi:MAG: EAL domain-containing protein [Pseudomonadota bacterium]
MTTPLSHIDSPGHHDDTILLLSFSQRDQLADELSRQGFRVVAARRAEGIERRFRGLDSAIVVLDARGAFDRALAAAEALASSIAAKNANILLLYDRVDADRLSGFADRGVSAMLPAPWHDAEMTLAIGLARRRTGSLGPTPQLTRLLWWHANLTTGAIVIDGSTDNRILDAVFGGKTTLRDVLRQFSKSDRHRAMTAYRKLCFEGGYTAFSQTSSGAIHGGQFVHHLVMKGNRLAGHVEWLGAERGQDSLASADRSTGLTSFAASLSQCRGPLREHAAPPTIALVQIDGLARFAFNMGQPAADALLRGFARQFERMVRQELGHAAQLSLAGDCRFAVASSDQGIAQRLVLEVRLIAAGLCETTLRPAHAGLSLRMASSTLRRDDSAQSVLARMIRRLKVPQAVVEQLDIEAALSKGEVIVRFQPQFSMDDDRLIGAEALARWHHPVLGELGGGALFAAAQASGLTHAVSMHVWEQALGMMASWPASLAHLRVALNITAHDMAVPTLAGGFLGLARRAGVAPDRLTVEVTESALIAQPDMASGQLDELRGVGVKVALDDFGTGYSGLAWLKQLPVDMIKIDSGFARDAHGSERDAAVLRGVINFAGGLGMGVLAEGVESIAQRDQLAAMGCRWYQGFLKSPALVSADFVAFAAAN